LLRLLTAGFGTKRRKTPSRPTIAVSIMSPTCISTTSETTPV
jgi:hypothetical protein